MKELERYKKLILPVLQHYFIKRAAFFGSFVKGNFDENSDIDLLIEPAKEFTLFKLLKIESELSDLLNRRVDLVEYSAIKLSIRDEVLSSSITILE